MTEHDGITVAFEVAKETKNALRYEEVPGPGEPIRIGSLYLQKWVVERWGSQSGASAKRITVTVKPTN